MLAPWKKSYDKPRQHIKKWRHHFANKGLFSQSYGFSSSPVRMWELDHIEGWVPKNWYFRIVVLEKALESPLDSKGIKPVNSRGNQLWIYIGRTNAEAETPILWPPDAKILWERPWCWERLKAVGRRGRQRQNGWMVSPTQWTWFEQTPRDVGGQRSLVCCSPWGCKKSNMA